MSHKPSIITEVTDEDVSVSLSAVSKSVQKKKETLSLDTTPLKSHASGSSDSIATSESLD